MHDIVRRRRPSWMCEARSTAPLLITTPSIETIISAWLVSDCLRQLHDFISSILTKGFFCCVSSAKANNIELSRLTVVICRSNHVQPFLSVPTPARTAVHLRSPALYRCLHQSKTHQIKIARLQPEPAWTSSNTVSLHAQCAGHEVSLLTEVSACCAVIRPASSCSL
jgi:hypothetical protein